MLLRKVFRCVVVEIPLTGIYIAVQLCKQCPHLVDGPFSCWLDKLPSRQAIKHQYFLNFRQNSKQETSADCHVGCRAREQCLAASRVPCLAEFLELVFSLLPSQNVPIQDIPPSCPPVYVVSLSLQDNDPSIVKFVRYFCADVGRQPLRARRSSLSMSLPPSKRISPSIK